VRDQFDCWRGFDITQGESLANSPIRVLVVEDYEPFRRFLCSTLQERSELHIIGTLSNGVDAIEHAEKLQPDVILLDIGLPKLSGMDAARRIREVSPQSKIVFVSQESSIEIVQETFNLGAQGYVLKADAESELLTAIDVVLRGERFIGRSLAGHRFTADVRVPESVTRNNVVNMSEWRNTGTGHHEAHFYSDDASFLDGFTEFIATALGAGNAVIVMATEVHRNNLYPRLQAYGLDIGSAVKQGRYIALDAAEALSKLIVNDLLDPTRFLEAAGNLITTAAKAANGERRRVAICGECEFALHTQNKGEVAIRLEQLWNQITATHYVDILCGYALSSFHSEQSSEIFERICAEHSAVCTR